MSIADPPESAPAHQATIVLKDGAAVRVRPVTPGDGPAVARLLASLSLDSRVFRFFSAGADLDRAAATMVAVDGDRQGLLATTGADNRVIAHGMYVRTAPRRAEVAFAVADDYQGRGLGTLLMGQMAESAQARGIDVFEAVVMPGNHRMLDMFRESGFSLRVSSAPGEIHVEFPTGLSAEALASFEQRDQAAAVAAVRTLLAPRSVAVVGASRPRGGIAAETFHNLLATGFNGP